MKDCLKEIQAQFKSILSVEISLTFLKEDELPLEILIDSFQSQFRIKIQ